MDYRIFVTGTRIAEVALELLRTKGCAFEIGDPADSPDDLAMKLAAFDPDGLIVRQGRITDAVQAAAKRLRVICKHGVGTDNIDVAAATRRGIPVLFTPGTNTEAVAEHALALMLSLLRRVSWESARVRSGVYEKAAYGGRELLGATVGLVGFGRIARRLCELLAPFEVSILVYHPSCTEEALPPHVSKVRSFDELLPNVDVLSLHCPLSAATERLVGGRALSLMKKGSYIVNTARGGLLDEQALLDAIREKRIAGAALDVLEQEPPSRDSPMLREGELVVTPHVGGLSDRSMENMGLQAVRNVLSVLEGQPVDRRSVLNADVLAQAGHPPRS